MKYLYKILIITVTSSDWASFCCGHDTTVSFYPWDAGCSYAWQPRRQCLRDWQCDTADLENLPGLPFLSRLPFGCPTCRINNQSRYSVILDGLQRFNLQRLVSESRTLETSLFVIRLRIFLMVHSCQVVPGALTFCSENVPTMSRRYSGFRWRRRPILSQ